MFQLKSPRKPKGSENMSVFGVAVSTMVNTETSLDDELKTVFDWCKEGNTIRVKSLLDQKIIEIDDKDEEVNIEMCQVFIMIFFFTLPNTPVSY